MTHQGHMFITFDQYNINCVRGALSGVLAFYFQNYRAKFRRLNSLLDRHIFELVSCQIDS